MPAIIPEQHPLATPNPSIWALQVLIDEMVILNEPEIIPPEGTLYKDFASKVFPKNLYKKFANYKYVNSGNGPEQQVLKAAFSSNSENAHTGALQDKKLSLLFLPTLTQEQRDTPFRVTTSMGNHRWAPILERLDFYRDDSFPRSTNRMIGGRGSVVTGPSYYVRENYRPECNEGSRFRIEEFFSDVPYATPPYLVPVARSVSFDVPGVRGSFPECIGPEINIPNFQTANLAFFTGNANAVNANGSVGGQFFPKTNFQKWSPYVVSDQTHFDNGYRKTRIWVFPPLVSNRLITQ